MQGASRPAREKEKTSSLNFALFLSLRRGETAEIPELPAQQTVEGKVFCVHYKQRAFD